MVKVKESRRDFCARMVREFPGTFRADQSVLFCILCECPITAEKLSHVRQHIRTDKHEREVNKRSESGPSARQSLLTEQRPDTSEKASEYSMDLCKTFIEANIPLKKVGHASVVKFLEKYTGKAMPKESTLRRKCVRNLFGCPLTNRLTLNSAKLSISFLEFWMATKTVQNEESATCWIWSLWKTLMQVQWPHFSTIVCFCYGQTVCKISIAIYIYINIERQCENNLNSFHRFK